MKVPLPPLVIPLQGECPELLGVTRIVRVSQDDFDTVRPLWAWQDWVAVPVVIDAVASTARLAGSWEPFPGYDFVIVSQQVSGVSAASPIEQGAYHTLLVRYNNSPGMVNFR